MFVSSSSLNSLGHTSHSLRLSSCSQYSATVFNKASHANPGGCKNVLDSACNFLSAYSERFQTHLPTVKHLFLSRYRDSSLGSFSPSYSKPTLHVHNPLTPQRCNVIVRNIYHLHVAFALITLNPTCTT